MKFLKYINLKLIIGHLISFVFIYLLIDKIDLNKLEGFQNQIHWEYFFLAIFINVISYFVHALRWNRFFLNQKVNFSNLIKTILIGHMFNTILPSKAGELMRPMYFHRITKIAYIDILSTCFIERVFDGLLVLFFLLVSIYTFGTNDYLVNATFFTMILYVGCLVFAILSYYLRKQIIKVINNQSNKLFKLASLAFQEFINGIKRINSIKNLLWIIFFTLLYWGLNILALWSILYTVNLPAELQTILCALFIAGSMGVALSLPSAPANIGVYHYAIYFIFTLIVESYENILVDSNLFIIAAVLIHLGAIIPDIILGAVSYYTFPKTKKDNLQE